MIETDERGKRLKDDNLLLLLNAHHEDIAFKLPEFEKHHNWDVLLDTKDAIGVPGIPRYKEGETYPLSGRTLVLLKQAQPI
jgi:glycogen operon protein